MKTIGQRNTVRSLTEEAEARLMAHGIETPRLDAEVLLSNVLGIERFDLLLIGAKQVSFEETERFLALIQRRLNFEPVAYLTGKKEFFGLDFMVNRHVLIPRPDTETLVEEALRVAPKHVPLRILDVCTGSGCIGVALAAHLLDAKIWAIDLSSDALKVARRNIDAHRLQDRITLRQGDLLEPVRSEGPFDLIVSNPPYIPMNAYKKLGPEVKIHEPSLALVGGDEDGLRHLRRILQQSLSLLSPNQMVILENGYDQEEQIGQIEPKGFCKPKVVRDLAGHPRVSVFKKL